MMQVPVMQVTPCYSILMEEMLIKAGRANTVLKFYTHKISIFMIFPLYLL